MSPRALLATLGSRRRRAAVAVAIYVVCTFVYFACASRERVVAHTPYNHYALLADCWVHRRLDLGHPPPAYTGNNDFASYQGRWYISFPPFPAVLLVPLAAIAGSPERIRDGQFFLWMAGLGPAILFLALEKLSARKLSRRSQFENAALALLFAFGTVYFFTAEQGTVWFAAHVVAVALGAFYLWAAIGAERPLLAGLALGLLYATRPPMVFGGVFFLLETLRVGVAWRASFAAESISVKGPRAREPAAGPASESAPLASPASESAPLGASASEGGAVANRSTAGNLAVDLSVAGSSSLAPAAVTEPAAAPSAATEPAAAPSAATEPAAAPFRRPESNDASNVTRLLHLARSADYRFIARKVGLFALAPLAIWLLISWHNRARFGSMWVFGHEYLTVGWRARIEKWGLASYHYLGRNLGIVLTSLPYLNDVPAGVQINTHGLALWITTPLYLWLLWPRRTGWLWWSLVMAAACVALPDLLYQNSGWLQFGYRFSNDFAVFLFAMLAVGGFRFRALWWTAAAFGVIVNTFGALTFDRPAYERFYFSDPSQRIIYQPD